MTPLLYAGLCLRPLAASDTQAYVDAARESAATVGRWMPWCHEDYSLDEAQQWLAVCHQGWAAQTACEYGLFAEDGVTLLGGAGLNQFNLAHQFCNLGYWVRQSRQGTGVASRAVKALASHGFGTLGLTRIEIVIQVGNEPSRAVARKAGAMYECTARNRVVVNGRPTAGLVYSLVPPDQRSSSSA